MGNITQNKKDKINCVRDLYFGLLPKLWVTPEIWVTLLKIIFVSVTHISGLQPKKWVTPEIWVTVTLSLVSFHIYRGHFGNIGYFGKVDTGSDAR